MNADGFAVLKKVDGTVADEVKILIQGNGVLSFNIFGVEIVECTEKGMIRFADYVDLLILDCNTPFMTLQGLGQGDGFGAIGKADDDLVGRSVGGGNLGIVQKTNANIALLGQIGAKVLAEAVDHGADGMGNENGIFGGYGDGGGLGGRLCFCFSFGFGGVLGFGDDFAFGFLKVGRDVGAGGSFAVGGVGRGRLLVAAGCKGRGQKQGGQKQADPGCVHIECLSYHISLQWGDRMIIL